MIKNNTKNLPYMKKLTLILVYNTLFYIITFGQSNDYKQMGFDAFSNENYPLAIDYMRKALKSDPNDSEVYYYLGYYIHYNAYDSRPLKGYNLNYSDSVLYFFEKALALNPNYGDAKYFFTAECGANAFYSLQKKDYESFTSFLDKAYKIGGFPEWSLEFGRNLLNQVEKNGILFVHGDFQLNLCWYLQYCDGFRKDISVIPLVMLNRPFYVYELKNSDLFKPVHIQISDEQIFNMHPYKWQKTNIRIPVSEKQILNFDLKNTYIEWSVSPDLKGKREYLSCERAFLLEIIESNKWERPIYWSFGMDDRYLAGLEEFGSYQGLVYKLMPFKTLGTEYKTDFIAIEKLLQNDNFSHYKNILKTNQPRISGIAPYAYSNAIIEIAKIYKGQNQIEKLNDILKFYQSQIQIGLYPIPEEEYYDKIIELLE